MPNPAPRMKYAHVETERRFLLATLPDGWSQAVSIEDRYLHGTRLRLRVTTSGDEVVRKLGQKIRLDGARAIAHTTLYLDEGEYAVLATLPAAVLTKTRHLYPDGTAVDVHADGTVIAEVDGGTGTPELPAWLSVVREVTDDEELTGAGLAHRAPTTLEA